MPRNFNIFCIGAAMEDKSAKKYLNKAPCIQVRVQYVEGRQKPHPRIAGLGQIC